MQAMTLNEMTKTGFTVHPAQYNRAHRISFNAAELDVLGSELIRRITFLNYLEKENGDDIRLNIQGAKHLLGMFRTESTTCRRTFRLTDYELGFLVDTLQNKNHAHGFMDMSETARSLHTLFNRTRSTR